MDFRDPFVEVEESAGNVTLCVYICDGGLKRNASITFATEATCEWYMHVLSVTRHSVFSTCLFYVEGKLL